MALPSTLSTRFIAWRGVSAQVKLYYRGMREGSIPLTPDNLKAFEGALYALDTEAVRLIEDAAELVRKSADLVAGALAMLDDAQASQRYPTENEVGELVDEAREHREQVTEPEPFFPAPVYQPEVDRGWLGDMAKPVNVVVFPGRRWGKREGGAS